MTLTSDIHRIPNRKLPSKSAVSIYRLPGGEGFMWAVATSQNRTPDIRAQTQGTLDVRDGYVKAAGLDRTCVVKAELVVTDHDNKPAFDEVWAAWMPYRFVSGACPSSVDRGGMTGQWHDLDAHERK